MITLIVKPGKTPGTFNAQLDGKPIGRATRQPLADGARALIEQGYAANTLLNMRHWGARHPSFNPATAGSWAGITYAETAEGPRSFKYKPFPPSVKGKKRPPA